MRTEHQMRRRTWKTSCFEMLTAADLLEVASGPEGFWTEMSVGNWQRTCGS